MKLSENFELREFTRSDTATRKGIANDPGVQEVKAIENLVTNLLQPPLSCVGSSEHHRRPCSVPDTGNLN